jgi:hypothetical protein
MRVYHCVVLPSALMSRAAPGFDIRFDPVTLKIESCLGWPREVLAREAEKLNSFLIEGGGRPTPMCYWWAFGPPRRTPALVSR